MSVPVLFHIMLHVMSNDSEYGNNSDNNNTNNNALVLNPYPPSFLSSDFRKYENVIFT